MKNKKAVIITIVIVAIIMLAVASWLIYKKFFKKDSTEEDVKDETMPDWGTNNTTTYSQTQLSNATFPIKKGMKGSEVEKIQAAINKKCGAGLTVDGDFGSRTESALFSCYKTKEVSTALFTQMGFDLGSGSPAASTGFSKGNKVYLKGNSVGIYNFPESKSQWIVGNVTKSILGTNPFGTWVGKANSSFDKVLVVGYIGKDGKPVVLNPPKELFVPSLLISKSAY
jgi:hypothetical protein